MRPDNTIGADYLKGIHEALALAAPDLQHHITTLLRKGPLPSGELRPGESIYHKYEVQMRSEDAAAILEALHQVERRFGYNKKFFDRQINLLAGTWHHHAERLRTESANA